MPPLSMISMGGFTGFSIANPAGQPAVGEAYNLEEGGGSWEHFFDKAKERLCP